MLKARSQAQKSNRHNGYIHIYISLLNCLRCCIAAIVARRHSWCSSNIIHVLNIFQQAHHKSAAKHIYGFINVLAWQESCQSLLFSGFSFKSTTLLSFALVLSLFPSTFIVQCMCLRVRARDVIHYVRKEPITAWERLLAYTHTHTHTQFNDETLLTAIRIFNQNHIWCLYWDVLAVPGTDRNKFWWS